MAEVTTRTDGSHMAVVFSTYAPALHDSDAPGVRRPDQGQGQGADGELARDDVARIVGCWHGLSKRGPQFDGYDVPMRRAVAFTSAIKQSKRFEQAFPEIVDAVLADRRDANAVKIETRHVDGSHNVKVRSEAIAWLEEHVRYETVEPYPLVEEWADGADPETDPSVLLVGSKKMRYPKISDPDIGKKNADKASGIVNDPNQWGLERGEPRYILDLVKRVVTVSLRTVEIVDSLPRLTF